MIIIGCGYTGTRLALRLNGEGRPVLGTTAHKKSVHRLEELGIAATRMNLDKTGKPLPALDHDRILYLSPPPLEGEVDPRLARFLKHLRDDQRTPRIVYTSTTGVYGDCGGAWVTEERPLNPSSSRARRRADAERQLRAWAAETGGEVVILRVAGIYGPERLPIDRLQAGMPVLREDEAPYSNRIHVDDLVEVCLAAMERGRPGEAYNVADGTPTTMSHYFTLLAGLIGAEAPPAIGWKEAEELLPPGLLSFLRENRRIDTTRMRDELGVQLRYPDLAEGLRASLAASEDRD